MLLPILIISALYFEDLNGTWILETRTQGSSILMASEVVHLASFPGLVDSSRNIESK